MKRGSIEAKNFGRKLESVYGENIYCTIYNYHLDNYWFVCVLLCYGCYLDVISVVEHYNVNTDTKQQYSFDNNTLTVNMDILCEVNDENVVMMVDML